MICNGSSDLFQILCVLMALGEDPVFKKEKGTWGFWTVTCLRTGRTEFWNHTRCYGGPQSENMEKNNALETQTFLSSYRLQRDSLCSDTHTAVDFGNIVTRGVYCNSASFIGPIMSHLCSNRAVQFIKNPIQLKLWFLTIMKTKMEIKQWWGCLASTVQLLSFSLVL